MFGIRKLLVVVGMLAVTGTAVAEACPPEVRTVSRVVHVQPVETIVVARVETPVIVKSIAVQPTPHSVAAPAQPPVSPLKQVPVGAKLALRVPFAGTEAGIVYVRMGGIAFQAKIESWGQGQVIFRLPAELNPVEKDEVPATIEAYSADGRFLKKVAVSIVTQPDLAQILDSTSSQEMPISTAAVR